MKVTVELDPATALSIQRAIAKRTDGINLTSAAKSKLAQSVVSSFVRKNQSEITAHAVSMRNTDFFKGI